MRWMSRAWVGSTVALVLVTLFLTGCPKRPEVVETVPKPMAPQGEVGMPAPPPTPRVAVPEEKSPIEVTAQPSEAKLTPETGAVKETQIAEAEAKPGITTISALKDVFFDYDQSAIREESKKLLAENVEWLRKNPATKVTIEGHCDERGSSEYNLALGERRARATRDYLVASGIAANRISTISFGKERPFALGHDESAWQWNRRAHFAAGAK
ncbi:peptidoglycan-associated lipoprotein Pal [Candidatus Methylomirabilis sp.]|uniref:Peptidoglycan-associated lipoprotein n=1 Tax=Candidatus Methylomirabilis tolerans TaxID=3123416 RepID=A0AAJ1ET22_9BACT|nr:peptidoglycan-associated lipoprotein Pal [Candidatus Methylomirabilis sp.]